jgi:hypothetical protein
MSKSAPRWLAALAVGVGLVAGGCAERKTTVRRETETVRTQPRVVEEHTVVPAAPSDETTVIERHRRTVEDDQ